MLVSVPAVLEEGLEAAETGARRRKERCVMLAPPHPQTDEEQRGQNAQDVAFDQGTKPVQEPDDGDDGEKCEKKERINTYVVDRGAHGGCW